VVAEEAVEVAEAEELAVVVAVEMEVEAAAEAEVDPGVVVAVVDREIEHVSSGGHACSVDVPLAVALVLPGDEIVRPVERNRRIGLVA
jgi:hypothetical protein